MKAHAETEALRFAINRDKYLGHFYGSTKPSAHSCCLLLCFEVSWMPLLHFRLPPASDEEFQCIVDIGDGISDFIKHPLPSVMWQIVFSNFPKMAVVISPTPHALPEHFLLLPSKRWSLTALPLDLGGLVTQW